MLEMDEINSNVSFSHFDLEVIRKSADKLEESNEMAFFLMIIWTQAQYIISVRKYKRKQ